MRRAQRILYIYPIKTHRQMDIDTHLDNLQRANHNIGRSEAIRDAARIVYAYADSYHLKCEERAREFSQDPNATGYLVDDRVYNAYHSLYSALNEVHKQITSLR